MPEKFLVELITIDKEDDTKDESITKTVHASSKFEAIAKAEALVRVENPDFNFMEIWAWHTPRRPAR